MDCRYFLHDVRRNGDSELYETKTYTHIVFKLVDHPAPCAAAIGTPKSSRLRSRV